MWPTCASCATGGRWRWCIRPCAPSAQQHQTVTDTAIQTNRLRDLYIALGGEQGGKVVLRLHVNTLAPFVWLGALVMAFGGALSLVDRRLRVGAPARRGAVGVPA